MEGREKMTPSIALGTWIMLVVTALLFAVALAAALAIPVMLLWNEFVADLFDLKRIGYVQAFGLLLLARLFFAPPIKMNK